MNLPIVWLKEYVPEALEPAVLRKACERWAMEPSKDPVQTLGQLMTFAGFNLEEIVGKGDEAVLDLEVLANRPDAQGVLGLAREVAVLLGVEVRMPDVELTEGDEAAGEFAQIQVLEPEMCLRYTARIIRGVKVGPSPEWLQKRLTAMGLVPRNNIVDITNFVLFEYNQPLHAFDLNRLAEKKIIVRRADQGEIFTPLYDSVPPLTPDTLVIADAERAVAIGGVIGGKGSEVENDTTDILLEAAGFHPGMIRRTCRALKVSTDSSFRFERGVDLEGIASASARAAKLIAELAGGTIAQGLLDSNPHPRKPKEVELRSARLRSLVGIEIPASETKRILGTLGCELVRESAEGWVVKIPSWRRGDLEREVDLIEEVARLHGYDKIPAETAMRATIPEQSAGEVAGDALREGLAQLGYFECVTDSLVDPKAPAAPVWTKADPLQLAEESVMREDHSQLRTSLLTSLLRVYRHNQDQRAPEIRIFECGKVYLPSASAQSSEAEAAHAEKTVVGLVDDRGFAALNDAVTRLPEALSIQECHLKIRPLIPEKVPPYLEADSACRLLRVRELHGGERAEDGIGWLGRLSADLVSKFGLKRTPAVAEFDLHALAWLPSGPARYLPLPSQPEVARDVAILVDESIPWGDIESYVEGYVAKEPLRDEHVPPRFLSVYRSKKLEAGKKSVAFSVIYRAQERSLTDEEVNTAHEKFVGALLSEFKAVLRA